MSNGVEFYRGPSLLTGEPIVAVATGLDGHSHNAKTGPMVQAWILRSDLAPMAAARVGADAAICGDCVHRGDHGANRSCYVTLWLAPNNVFKQLGTYPVASWPDLRLILTGLHIRLGAYGDPAALPCEVWRVVLERAAGWTGYTHQWRTCDPRLKRFLMASVDTEHEMIAAHLGGWRTFRVRSHDQALMADEVICPASAEGDHRATCDTCELCRGQANPARSVVIMAHGNPGQVANYYRRAVSGIVPTHRAS